MISIVIPAYNEEKRIGKCLDALVNQRTSQKFEVIVVDNNSTDRTVDIAKTFRKKLHLTILIEKQKGRGAARYRGFQQAKGDIVFSTDADCAVPTTWIEEFSRILKQSNAVAVTGTCKVIDCNPLTCKIINSLYPYVMKFYRLVVGHFWLSGFSFAIYKDAYERSGGFNPKLNIQEDIELSFKVRKIGTIKFVPNLPVVFSGRRFQKGLLTGFLPYATTFIQYFVFKKEDVILSDIR